MKTKTQIEFGFVDVTAKSDSNLSIANKQEFVDITDLKRDDLEEIKYGTLEKNQFVLDGSFELMPEELDNMGLWSKRISNEFGKFEKPLVLVIKFSEPHSSLGLTFLFSKAGDYCNHLSVAYYNANGNLINETDFYPNNYQYVCNNVVNDYEKIIIIFYSTNHPYRYLKLYQILYGAKKIFEGDNLISANILEDLDLLSSELTINTLGFKVYSEDDEFNIINPTGFYSLLQQRQAFKVKELILKENKEIDMGTFYLDTWKNADNRTMEFEAIDLLGVIDKSTFYGGMYININFADLIDFIMASANVSEENYEIQEDLKLIQMTGYIPVCTHREALQQAVFAIGAVADCSRSSKIKIYTIVDREDNNTIEQTNIFQNTKTIEQNAIVSEVSITAHNFEQGTESEELFKGTLDKGFNRILFDNPVHDLSCIGGIITENNCNYAIVNCSEEQEVIINGYKYVDNTREISVKLEDINASNLNALNIESAFFINKNNAQKIAKKVLDYYKNTYTTGFEFIVKEEKLTEDIAIGSNDFSRLLVGHIKKLDIDLTGGFLANAEINARVRLLTKQREVTLCTDCEAMIIRNVYVKLPVEI